MTSTQYTNIIKRLGFNHGKAAAFLGVDIRTSFRYAAEETPIPEGTAKLLRLMVKLKLSPEEVD